MQFIAYHTTGNDFVRAGLKLWMHGMCRGGFQTRPYTIPHFNVCYFKTRFLNDSVPYTAFFPSASSILRS